MALRLTTQAADRVLAHGLLSEIDAGHLNLYSGSRPKTPDAGLELQALLVSIPLTAFTASVGTLTTTAFTPELIQATGEARWAQLLASDGATLGDLTVGTLGRDPSPDVILDRTDLQKGGTCVLERLTIVLPTS